MSMYTYDVHESHGGHIAVIRRKSPNDSDFVGRPSSLGLRRSCLLSPVPVVFLRPFRRLLLKLPSVASSSEQAHLPALGWQTMPRVQLSTSLDRAL